MVLRGLGVSEAARPTSSVPAKAKAAVTNTVQTPLKPLANAPGSLQYLPPMYSLYMPLLGPPPQMQTLNNGTRLEFFRYGGWQEYAHANENEHDDDEKFQARRPEFLLSEAQRSKDRDYHFHCKLVFATVTRKLNINSHITNQNIVIHPANGRMSSPQYCTVVEATVISSGKTTAHWKT